MITQEDIHKAAIELCTTEAQEEWLQDYGIHCFLDGARWRIDSVWHDMDIMPNFRQLPILMEHKTGSIHFIDGRLSVWAYLKKHYVRWAYVADLLPDRKEEEK